jgi:two-component system, OmpR family, sensor histidine kinase KdpD
VARGQLRVYLGAAPGVGKTYAMLNEGWRRHERGTDVVIGYVETHRRPNTEVQVRDLECIPRKRMTYRDQVFEEMDLDTILARKPAWALVDELAHTNVPGSRNEKRWEDINDLLDAGINVISTVNIQHLESLNDVVERITGIKQRETVPDAVVRAADQIELVDMAPEALRRRMAHGNIYGADKVDAALGNYFRVGNLAALRELALLWMADRVDEELHEYRQRHGIEGPWETKERVLVAITGAPGGDDLIRRAARMAMRTRGELVGVHVVAGDGLAGPASSRLDEHRELLTEVGGRYVEASGADVARALVQAARGENATQIVLGASRRSRLTELFRGSVINSVIRAAGGAIDVHVISPSTTEGPDRSLLTPPRIRLAPLSRHRRSTALILTASGLPTMTLLLTQVRDSVGFQNALLLYLLFVVAIATIGGAIPGALASIAGFLLLNWFFAPPIHTFTISNGRDALALVSFLVVAGVISALVDLATRRRDDALRARAEARALAAMAGTVLQDPEPLPKLAHELATSFQLDGVAIFSRKDDQWHTETNAGSNPPTTPDDASESFSLPDGAVLAWSGTELRARDREVLAAFDNQLAIALQGRRLQAEAAQATALAKANELRTALLAAVSHDLRTPLASIRAAATSLLTDDVEWDPATSRQLLSTIDEEAERLNALVGNLLDMSRLQTGGVTITAQAIGIEEIVAAALVGLHVPADRIEVDVPETLPRIRVDATLLERAVANVIDNALSFSPLDKPIRVEAASVGSYLHLRVIDGGPGISVHDRERVFQPFQRLGDNPNGMGVGLGLAVAKGFVTAMGGELDIEDTPGGGCTMILAFPVAEP